MISTGSVKSSESSEEESSLGWADESQTLDGFGSMSSSSLDSLGGEDCPAAAFLRDLLFLWWDLCAMRMLYSLLKDFPDLEAALVTLRPNPCSWVNP